MPEEMPEKTRQLFLIFRDAVQRERDAQVTYKRAAGALRRQRAQKASHGLLQR